MPIAPITGKLRKRFWVDLTASLGFGVAAGYAYWSVSLFLFFFFFYPFLTRQTGMGST